MGLGRICPIPAPGGADASIAAKVVPRGTRAGWAAPAAGGWSRKAGWGRKGGSGRRTGDLPWAPGPALASIPTTGAGGPGPKLVGETGFEPVTPCL